MTKLMPQAADNANQSGEHETVVQNELPDSCRTRTVKADTCQVGRIRRQEEIAVACRKEDITMTGSMPRLSAIGITIATAAPANLQVGSKEQDQAIRPWVLGHHRTEECFRTPMWLAK